MFCKVYYNSKQQTGKSDPLLYHYDKPLKKCATMFTLQLLQHFI